MSSPGARAGAVSRKGGNPAAQSTGATRRTTDDATFDQVLHHLGIRPDELVAVCHDLNGEFRQTIGPSGTAWARARPMAGRANVWFGWNPLKAGTGGRKASDVARLVALPVDLDVAALYSTIGKDDPSTLLPDRDAARAVVADLTAILGRPPRVTIRTGHGFQPAWQVDDDGQDMTRSGRVLARWGMLADPVVRAHGGSADNVFDLARITRVPGTTNVKDLGAPKPVTAALRDIQPLTLGDIESVLDAYGVPALDDFTLAATGEVLSSSGGWRWAESTCGYVAAMVGAWPGDSPNGSGRHHWHYSNAIRLVAAHRAGCITEADYLDAVRVLDRRLHELCDTTPPRRQVSHGDRANWPWAVRTVERKTDQQVRGELGNHLHDRAQVVDEQPPPPSCSLPQVHATFRRWFGERFDWQYLNIVLAGAAAGLHMDADPAWVQVVGGPGAAKTEVLAATEHAGCIVVSTLSGEAALLSATPHKDRAKDATGGLLRVVGDRGVLVIKDFTSILSMHREARGEVLGALREVYDGAWHRDVGVDGGKRLTWTGRCTVLSGVTGAYDDHYSVIASMGDRFLLVRLDSEQPEVRRHARRMAIRNSGGEETMRAELAETVAGFLRNIDKTRGDVTLDDPLVDEIGELADLITLARSEVSRDLKGDPQFAHAPEMPTRVAKQLVVMYRAGHMIGLGHDDAIRLVRRIAHDTIPPTRRKVLLAVHDHPDATSKDIAEKVGMARTSADRVLRELALHRLIRHQEEEYMDANGRVRERWRWSACTPVDLAVLRAGFGTTGGHVPEMSEGGSRGTTGGHVPEMSEGGSGDGKARPPAH